MQITIISVGKIKEKYLQEAIKEYSKRLTKYITLNIIEVKDEKEFKNMSEADVKTIQDIEAERIFNKLKPSYTIALCIEGNMLSSESLADKLNHIRTYHHSKLTFIIGGSHGLSESIKQQANVQLSFSQMTFPHQLMQVILLEQLFRSMKILNNEPYHK